LETRAEELPGPLLRPFPTQYVRGWTSALGLELTIRPIRPEDEPMIAAFHATLSDRTVFLRYMHVLSLSRRIAHERLTRICFDDYDREIALVAERADPATHSREIVGIGRMSKLHRRNEAEFAILVGDPYQRHGLGTELLTRLVQVARAEKQERVLGYVAAENTPMLRLCKKFGFRLHRAPDESEVEAVLEL
jgi:acetyltransferase